jgi:sec-independent protein translocase protein TatA
MGAFSIWHVLILAVVVFLLFGRGKISDLMGDVAKGIKNFRQGMQDHDEEPPRVISAEPRQPERHDETKDKAGP